jgi:hypothetical protein
LTAKRARLLPRATAPALVVSAVVVCTLLWWVRSAHSRAATSATARDRRPELHVPYAPEPISVDAETEGKTVWQSEAGSTGNLKNALSQGMVPYTEVKARWRADGLYLLLYAGDLDLEGVVTKPDSPLSGDDSFHIELGGGSRTYVIEVSVLGTVADAACARTESAPIELTNPSCDRQWNSHVKVAVDKDGTLNHVGDNDEEWVIEMAIGADALGFRELSPGTRIPFAVRRCDIRQGTAPHVCGSWGMLQERGELILSPRG